jgi:hypothetical protein
MGPRPVATLALALAMALGVLAIAAGSPAQAAAYRYWTYWQADGASWAFATQGPATTVPDDGAVDGWRFAVTTQSGSVSDAPRTTPDFEAICGSTPAGADAKRVALIVDFGPAAIAPDGQAPPADIQSCAVVPVDASSFDVLQSVTTVRTDGGLICSLGDYPVGECAPILTDDEVADLESSAASVAPAATDAEVDAGAVTASQREPTDPGSPVATIAVASLLIVGAAVGVVLGRRRERSDG